MDESVFEALSVQHILLPDEENEEEEWEEDAGEALPPSSSCCPPLALPMAWAFVGNGGDNATTQPSAVVTASIDARASPQMVSASCQTNILQEQNPMAQCMRDVSADEVTSSPLAAPANDSPAGDSALHAGSHVRPSSSACVDKDAEFQAQSSRQQHSATQKHAPTSSSATAATSLAPATGLVPKPRGRTPKSKVTGRPMQWCSRRGGWMEAQEHGDPPHASSHSQSAARAPKRRLEADDDDADWHDDDDGSDEKEDEDSENDAAGGDDGEREGKGSGDEVAARDQMPSDGSRDGALMAKERYRIPRKKSAVARRVLPETYQVEAIVDARIASDGVTTEYFIKWQGWASQHNTWEPKTHILDESVIHAFESQRPSLQGHNQRQAAERPHGGEATRVAANEGLASSTAVAFVESSACHSGEADAEQAGDPIVIGEQPHDEPSPSPERGPSPPPPPLPPLKAPHDSELSTEEHAHWLRLEQRRLRREPLDESERQQWDALNGRALAEQAAYRQWRWESAMAEQPSPFAYIARHVASFVDDALQQRTARTKQIYPAVYSRCKRLAIPRVAGGATPGGGGEPAGPLQLKPLYDGADEAHTASPLEMLTATNGATCWRLPRASSLELSQFSRSECVTLPHRASSEAASRCVSQRQPVLSHDAVAARLVAQWGAHAAISSSALVALLTSFEERVTAIEIPVRVRQTRADAAGVIFLDKPLVPPSVTARRKNEYFYRAALKKQLSALAHRHQQDGSASGGIGANLGSMGEGESGDRVHARDEPSASYSYRLFQLGEMRLLVRAKMHARLDTRCLSRQEDHDSVAAGVEDGEVSETTGEKGLPFCVLKVHMEYRARDGFESMSASDHARCYAQLAVRPGAQLLMCHVCGRTGALEHLEPWTLEELESVQTAFNPAESLRKLLALLRSVRDEGPGSYLIRRPGNGAGGFALWREGVSESLADLLMAAVNRRAVRSESVASAATSSSNAFNLHFSQQQAGATDTETITYQALQWRQPKGGPPQIPYTFPPSAQVQSNVAGRRATSNGVQASNESQTAAAEVAAENRKKPCRHFRQGACKFGSNCKWSHDVEPVRMPSGPAVGFLSEGSPSQQDADMTGSSRDKSSSEPGRASMGRGQGESGVSRGGGRAGRGRSPRKGRGRGSGVGAVGDAPVASNRRTPPASVGSRPGESVEHNVRDEPRRLRSREEGDRSTQNLRD